MAVYLSEQETRLEVAGSDDLPTLIVVHPGQASQISQLQIQVVTEYWQHVVEYSVSSMDLGSSSFLAGEGIIASPYSWASRVLSCETS